MTDHPHDHDAGTPAGGPPPDGEPLAARAAALDLIQATLRKGVPFDDALEANRGVRALEPRDRGFVRLLCATVFRRLGQLDALVQGALAKPGQPVKGPVQDILRLGAAQLLFLGTPAHAAVDTSVELAVARGQTPYKGLVNAVLRRLSREGAGLLAAQDAGRLNTPDWLWLAWRQAYGTGATRAIVEAHLAEPPLDITVRADADLWAERLGAERLPGGSLRLPAGGPVTELPGFAEGAWWVQDAAAAIPARLFGDVAGREVLDLCAAPGGKTAQLAAAGARVTAVDRSEKRLERLRENLARLGLEVETVAADATAWSPDAPVDAVLLDAPCSATGTIRRHPDVQRLKTEEDVAKLARVQARLLIRAADMLKPGGLLVYATCSLQPEEGERQVEALLARRPDLVRVPVDPAELGGLAGAVTAAGDVRTTPGLIPGGMDGFFAARLRRTG
ncbi:16S rRNA (cytosine(967)-C(5))-methyltransferase RsmB [Rhodospirillum centenum]|uniref:16S rRNA (cytosine(967)-C(5))-methyltransferase n=1 Tax=Rhodospirillum centenum (strain ATCC 51521 / SW) TaxID=414684 RepID=B6IPN2_RHOCS|nr:16S rRNA (cytosine(967)-C(5))-methyltransferase RsmB [Rhodospirillum centenum]ACI99734.1 ribosomal RNA small subunit methyltransferase B [Rhodospirillum centenum SW]